MIKCNTHIPRYWLTCTGLAIFLILPQIPFSRWIAYDVGQGHVVTNAVWWGLAAALLAWVLIVERRQLSSIGIRRPGWSTAGWALVLTVALMASVMLSYALILPAFGLEFNQATTKSITDLSIASQLAIFVRAAVVEELLFRGYPMERLLELTGSKWIAALVPGALFIGGHYWSWGAGQLIVVAFATLILSLFYLWRRDLISLMLAHFATDFIGFTLARLQS